jgi:hypothetical protein
MGVVSGILYGSTTTAPSGSDAGDANVWIGTGATFYDQIANGLAQASAGDVVIAGGDEAFRVIDDGGTLRAVRPEVYVASTITVEGRIDGDEADEAALTANGFSKIAGSGAPTFGGTTVDFVASNSYVQVDLDTTSRLLTTSTIYVAGRMQISSLSGTYQVHVANVQDGTDYVFIALTTVLSTSITRRQSSAAAIDYRRNANDLSSEAYVEVLIFGEWVRVYADGVLLHQSARDAQSTAATRLRIGPDASGGSHSATLSVRDLVAVTGT